MADSDWIYVKATGSKAGRCKVPWCIGVPKPEATACALHLKYPELHPDPLCDAEIMQLDTRGAAADEVPVFGRCTECGGSGKCDVCNGHGSHRCDDIRCDSEHECGACDGEGECEECHGTGEDMNDGEDGDGEAFCFLAPFVTKDREFARRYLRFNLVGVPARTSLS